MRLWFWRSGLLIIWLSGVNLPNSRLQFLGLIVGAVAGESLRDDCRQQCEN